MYIAVKPIQSHPFRQMCGLHVHYLIPLLFIKTGQQILCKVTSAH